MLKKVIKYENPFTGAEVSEEHYFHISKADLVEMEVEEHKASYTDKEGKELTGMHAKLQKIVDSEDGKAILFEMKDMIRRAYGKKNGDRFLKSAAIWEEFSSSEAYSQLIFELCTDASAAGEFINKIVPSNLEQVAQEVRDRAQAPDIEATETNGATTPVDDGPVVSTPVQPGQILSIDEASAMDQDELKSGLATGRYRLG